MSNIQVHKPTFSLQPTTFQEAKEYAEILAKSTFVPKIYQGKPGDILAAVQYGAELGLKPLQSLQNIAVINGRPSIYGDAALALVKAHSSCVSIEEKVDDFIATCTARRKGKPDVIHAFSKEDAETASLWGKVGPWKNYPKRMLQMRARSFALRDQFPDVLLGLILAEEAYDYNVINAEPVAQEKDNVVPIKAATPVISINAPASTYRFAELDATFTKEMTADKVLKYFEEKIETLNNMADLESYEKFKSINEVLLKRFYKENRQEAIGLGHTFESRKAFIARSIADTFNTMVDASEKDNKMEVTHEETNN